LGAFPEQLSYNFKRFSLTNNHFEINMGENIDFKFKRNANTSFQNYFGKNVSLCMAS